jgi:DNA invertase Pin-like site-specific DNA recombinase
MLTVLGALAEFERDLICTRTGEGRTRAEDCAARTRRRNACRNRPQPQCERLDDFGIMMITI